jgi:hypothetical protein
MVRTDEFASYCPDTEAAIWAHLIQSKNSRSQEIAEYLLSIDFGESDLQRMNLLAERVRDGTPTPEETAGTR